MNPNWAEENLQTIRTLMERSALYRRALAPIMLLAGTMGVLAAAIGMLCDWHSARAFVVLWLATAVLAVAGAFLIARRQALKDKETFWSPPTRRVAQALLPPLLAGLGIGGLPVLGGDNELALISAVVWILFYGCALHSAGFFMPRGIKFFGWGFIASALALIYIFMTWESGLASHLSAYCLMGFFFGVLHLAYGVCLYLTEKGKKAA